MALIISAERGSLSGKRVAMDNKQRQQLHQALLSAFPTPDSLRQMVSFELDQNLYTIAGGDNYSAVAFSLVVWAEAHGKVNELLAGASRQNSGNPELRELVAGTQQGLIDWGDGALDPAGPPAASDGHPTAPLLSFADIALARDEVCWEEDDGGEGRWKSWFRDRYSSQSGEPYRMCRQHFVTGYYFEADPRFDITVMNRAPHPLVLTAIGIEITLIEAYVDILGSPFAVEVPAGRSYQLKLPDVWALLVERGTYGPLEVRELVSTRVENPLYLDVGAVYRYELLLADYIARMPNLVILTMWTRTDQGEVRSHKIFLGYIIPGSYGGAARILDRRYGNRAWGETY
jgi:hypothetical protein